MWQKIKDYFNLTKGRKGERAKFIAEQEHLDEPWAMFEINGFSDDGRIKVEFNWNDAFVVKIHALGFQAETAEDSVQLFFYASQMKPTQLSGGDETVQSESHPQLSGQSNILRT
jgi:hypothetical protein